VAARRRAGGYTAAADVDVDAPESVSSGRVGLIGEPVLRAQLALDRLENRSQPAGLRDAERAAAGFGGEPIERHAGEVRPGRHVEADRIDRHAGPAGVVEALPGGHPARRVGTGGAQT